MFRKYSCRGKTNKNENCVEKNKEGKEKGETRRVQLYIIIFEFSENIIIKTIRDGNPSCRAGR